MFGRGWTSILQVGLLSVKNQPDNEQRLLKHFRQLDDRGKMEVIAIVKSLREASEKYKLGHPQVSIEAR
jgi:hypothetical protein